MAALAFRPQCLPASCVVLLLIRGRCEPFPIEVARGFPGGVGFLSLVGMGGMISPLPNVLPIRLIFP